MSASVSEHVGRIGVSCLCFFRCFRQVGNNINNFQLQLPFTRGLTRPRSFAKLGLGRDGARPSRTRLLAKFKARPKDKVVFESCSGCFKIKCGSCQTKCETVGRVALNAPNQTNWSLFVSTRPSIYSRPSQHETPRKAASNASYIVVLCFQSAYYAISTNRK